jgi:hypothetical protein
MSPGPTPIQNTPASQQEAPYGQYEESAQTGKVIRVKDIAFITYVYPNLLESL